MMRPPTAALPQMIHVGKTLRRMHDGGLAVALIPRRALARVSRLRHLPKEHVLPELQQPATQ